MVADLSKKYLSGLWKEYEKSHYNLRELARKQKVTVGAADYRIRKAKALYGFKEDLSKLPRDYHPNRNQHPIEHLQEVWRQYAECNYNAVDLARKLGKPINTVKQQIYNAKIRLKKEVPKKAILERRKQPALDMSDTDTIETFRVYAENGYNATAAATKIRVNRNTYQSRLSQAKARLGMRLEPNVALEAKEKQRLKDTILRLTQEKQKLLREEIKEEDLLREVLKLGTAQLEPPKWLMQLKAAGSSPGMPMLVASDFQWGEVIRAPEIDGFNDFNIEVAHRRYKVLISKTIDLSFKHMVRPNYPGIIYWRLGDMVSGDIHQELRETNEMGSIAAVLDLTSYEVAGIKELQKAFGRVYVVSVPGNHGRTTIKPFAKRFVETNYDYLSGIMLEREFKSDPNVTFYSPLSGDAIVNVFGYKVLGTHGDRIGSRGGEGFIGPAATIARGMKKCVDYYAGLGQTIDYQLIGHFHTSLELEYGWANGSLPGYGEYPKSFRMKPQPPSQWLLFVHPNHGVTCRWPILLESKPRLADSVVQKAFEPIKTPL